MKEFPLYDTMISNIIDKDLTLKQKKELLQNIEKINDKGFELLYMLIKVYSIKEQKSDYIPFNGKYITNNNIQFDLEELPNKLKQMLFKFVNLHLNVMKDEERPI